MCKGTTEFCFLILQRKLLLTCGMDRTVNLVDVSSDEIKILQTFTDHQKQVGFCSTLFRKSLVIF